VVLVCSEAGADEVVHPKLLGPAIPVILLTGRLIAVRVTAVATSSAAMGWIAACGNRTMLPSVSEAAMLSTTLMVEPFKGLRLTGESSLVPMVASGTLEST
jgi:hypothetical protein